MSTELRHHRSRAGDDLAGTLAHVGRRLTFGPFPGALEAAVEAFGQPTDLVEKLLDAPPIPFTPTYESDAGTTPVDIDEAAYLPEGDPAAERRRLQQLTAFRPWWVRRMMSDEAGLHEKMMWFWHTHFTSSFIKVDSTQLCWRQLRTFHRLALGNFGELLHAITVDGAMLQYLDGNRSIAEAPNENYARELMELFTIGRDEFTQDDVVAAAYALSGWHVELHSQLVKFDPSVGPRRRVTFLGRRARYDAAGIVDRLLADERCAPFVVAKLWRFFIGGEPDRDAVGKLADGFRSSGYELRPLLGRMLTSDAFLGARWNRPRSPIEWYCATVRAAGDEDVDAPLALSQLGQLPYDPPNVAGWPAAGWLSPTHLEARLRVAARLRYPAATALADATDLPGSILTRCSIPDASAPSRATLERVTAELRAAGEDAGSVARGVLAAAVLTPEHLLA